LLQALGTPRSEHCSLHQISDDDFAPRGLDEALARTDEIKAIAIEYRATFSNRSRRSRSRASQLDRRVGLFSPSQADSIPRREDLQPQILAAAVATLSLKSQAKGAVRRGAFGLEKTATAFRPDARAGTGFADADPRGFVPRQARRRRAADARMKEIKNRLACWGHSSPRNLLAR